MRRLLTDCRHAIRLYARTPGASAVAIAVLAVAMGVVGAFLSLYVDLSLRQHPGFQRSDRIVTIGQTDSVRLIGISLELIERIADEATTLDAMAGVYAPLDSFAVGPGRERVPVEQVTSGFFSGLRPRLALGRGFESEDHRPDAEPVTVISYQYWHDAFGGDPGVLGRVIEVSATEESLGTGPFGPPEPIEESAGFRIVGVMAPELPSVSLAQTALWLPFERALPLHSTDADSLGAVRSYSVLMGIGLRRDGASAAAIGRELNARYADGGVERGLAAGFRFDAVDGIVLDLNVQRDATRQLKLFLAGSFLLGVVAAANVSLFLLARAPGRRRELGIRMAVGAALIRLRRQLATEAALLVVASTVLGLLLSVWLSAYLRGLAFLRDADWHSVTLLDWRVIGLVGAFVTLLTLLVALAPILGLERLGIAARSRERVARATPVQRIAGTLQVAIAGPLAGAAIAFGWYLASLAVFDPGYTTRNVYAAQVLPAEARFVISSPDSREAMIVEAARRRETIEALPGVDGVAFGRLVPGAPDGLRRISVPSPTDPTERIDARQGPIDSRYVRLLGLRLLHGRAPAEGETDVLLVNQALARQVWGRDDVVGRTLPVSVFLGSVEPRGSTEIIGVLEDLSFEHPSADVPPTLFPSAEDAVIFSGFALLESRLGAADLQRQLQGLVDSGAVEVTFGEVRPLRAFRNEVIAADRARGLLTIATAVVVVLVAAIGFYGTQRFLVAAGRQEYAIRASVGAGPRALGRLVIARGLALAFPGLALGGLLAFILVAWLRDDYVSQTMSPALVTFAVEAGLILLLLAATFGPMRHAMRTRPAPLLRDE